MISLTSCLKRVSRPWGREGEPRHCLANHLSWRHRAEKAGRLRDLELAGWSPAVERVAQKKNSENVQSLPWVFSRRLISAGIWENYLRPGKEPPKMIRRSSAQHSYKAEKECLFPRVKLENFINRRVMGSVIRRVLPQDWGLFSSRLNVALVYLMA